MKRRSLLLSIPALALPVPTIAAPMRVESPLIPFVSGDVACFTSVRIISTPDPRNYVWNGPGGPGRFDVVYTFMGREDGPKPIRIETPFEVSAETGTAFSSIEAMEDFIIEEAMSRAHMTAYRSMAQPYGSCVGDTLPPPFIVANRCANLIAARTRVGPGTHLFMHEETFGQAVEDTKVRYGHFRNFPVEMVEPERVGRWTKRAMANRALSVYTCDEMRLGDGVVGLTSGAVAMRRGGELVLVSVDPGHELLRRDDHWNGFRFEVYDREYGVKIWPA